MTGPYRRVEGLAGSIVWLLGLALPIPDHRLVSRWAKTLRVQIPRRARTEPIHRVVDSTGLQVYGEGEWKVRQYGVGQRRTWRKVHWAVDAHVKDGVAVEVTTGQWTDGEVFAGFLEQIDEPIAQIDADGVNDTRAVYQAAAGCGADLVVPPRVHVVPWAADPPRTQALAAIVQQGLAAWKLATDPYRRSLAEMPCIASNNCLGIAELAGIGNASYGGS